MRSTRAAAAVARLNRRCPGEHHTMTRTSDDRYYLSRQTQSGEDQLCEALPQDDFVRAVDALGPQQVRRITKNDAAFEKQLVKKPQP
jgi:hypothetical protein